MTTDCTRLMLLSELECDHINPLGPIADLAVIIDSTYFRRHK